MRFGVVFVDWQEDFCYEERWNDRTARASLHFADAVRGLGQDVVEFHYNDGEPPWPPRDRALSVDERFLKNEDGFFNSKGRTRPEIKRFLNHAAQKGWTHAGYGGCNIRFCFDETVIGSAAQAPFATSVFVDLISARDSHKNDAATLGQVFRKWRDSGITLLHSESYLRHGGQPELVYGEALSARDALSVVMESKRRAQPKRGRGQRNVDLP